MRASTARQRSFLLTLVSILLFTPNSRLWADSIDGHYLEARTCQVYTGPCFANGEMGIAGKDAVMAWSIREGVRNGIDLAGLNVALVLRASETLGHQGLANAKSIRSLIVLDQAANSAQREALIGFVQDQAAAATADIAAIEVAPINMELDIGELTGSVTVGDYVTLRARKAKPGDCICSNESAFYPPLARLDGFVPGVTIDGEVKASSLGSRWSIPDSRTAYLGTFSHSTK